jgi:hypothetical protein
LADAAADVAGSAFFVIKKSFSVFSQKVVSPTQGMGITKSGGRKTASG